MSSLFISFFLLFCSLAQGTTWSTWKGAKGIPTKGIRKKYWKSWISGCFQGIFRVFSGFFSGCLQGFSGCFQGVVRVFFPMPLPGMPFGPFQSAAWALEFQEWLWEWPFHSEQFFQEIAVVPRLLIGKVQKRVFPVEPQSPNGKINESAQKVGFPSIPKRVPKGAANRNFYALFTQKVWFSALFRTFWHSFWNRRKPHFLCRFIYFAVWALRLDRKYTMVAENVNWAYSVICDSISAMPSSALWPNQVISLKLHVRHAWMKVCVLRSSHLQENITHSLPFGKLCSKKAIWNSFPAKSHKFSPPQSLFWMFYWVTLSVWMVLV